METIRRMLGKLLNREESREEVDELKPMGWLDEMEPQDMIQEKQEETLKSRRAVSPVIATVILVAVTITVAVAVAYWMSGIAGQYTAFEKIEIKSAYASRKYTDTAGTTFKGWVITLDLQNTGSSSATLINCFVNDIPIAEYGADIIGWTTVATTDLWSGLPVSTPITEETGVNMDSGDSMKVYVVILGDRTVGYYGVFSAGTTINVKLHSAGGMDYIRLVRLS